LYDADQMAVSAHSDKELTFSATSGEVDMRTGGRPPAGTFVYEGDELVTSWHSHDLHQLEYALHGTVEVDTEGAHFLLPTQQAAWIPARVEHRTTIHRTIRTISVFFDPQMIASAGDRVRIVAVPPVLREMLRYAERWPIGRQTSAPDADAFFAALSYVVTEALEHETPLGLPNSSDPILAAAMAWTRAHLHEATVREAARHVGLSERSLRRRFETGARMSWRSYLLQARLLHAMAMLAEPSPSILHVATAVGFDSLSSFNRAFRQRTGETPSGYRKLRVAGAQSAQ
jgi:AraC-like DNA-binding protein